MGLVMCKRDGAMSDRDPEGQFGLNSASPSRSRPRESLQRKPFRGSVIRKGSAGDGGLMEMSLQTHWMDAHPCNIACSRDSSLLACGVFDYEHGSFVKVWQLKANREYTLDYTQARVMVKWVDFSPQQRQPSLCLALADQTQSWGGHEVVVVNYETGVERLKIIMPSEPSCATYSPDCTKVAGGTEEGYLGIYDANDGQELWCTTMDGGKVMCTFSPNSRYVAQCCLGFNGLGLHDADTGELLHRFDREMMYLDCAFSRDSAHLVATGVVNMQDLEGMRPRATVVLFVVENKKELWRKYVQGIGCSFAGRGEVVYAAADTRVEVADLTAGKVLRTHNITDSDHIIAGQGGVFVVAENGRGIAALGQDKIVRVWRF